MLFLQSGGTLKTWRSKISFFLLGVLWSNLHNPCAMIGVGIVGSAGLWRLIIERENGQPWQESIKDFLWPTSLSLLALFTNPYGASLIPLALANIAPIHDSLGEWKRPWTYLQSDAPLHFVCAIAPIFTAALCGIISLTVLLKSGFAKNRKWISKGGGPIIFMVASQTAIRLIYLCVPGLVWALSRCNLRSKYMRTIFIASIFALSVVLVNYQIVRQGGMQHVLENFGENIWPGYYPEAAVTIIDEANLSGKVFCPSSWGGYLLWFARPPRGVAFDGRNNASPEVWNIENQILSSLGNDPQSIIQSLDDLGVDIAVLPKGSFPFSHWPTSKWIRIAHDAISEVFIRINSPDMISLRDFFQLPQNTKPVDVENTATYFFGELYYRSERTRIIELQKKQDEDSFFKLIEIYRISGHDDEAIDLLSDHLQKDPGNIKSPQL